MDSFAKFFNQDHDIKFRGGISYRGLRFIGLVAMTISQFGFIFYLICKAENFLMIEGIPLVVFPEWLHILCTALGHITFPCLLIAAFATVFSKTDEIIRVLITNFVLAALTFVFYTFYLPRIIESGIKDVSPAILEAINVQKLISLIASNQSMLGPLGEMLGGINLAPIIGSIDWSQILGLIKEILPQVSTELTRMIIINFVNINVFLDLFLCTLFYFFISYKPKKLQGGKLMLFRCCAVLPAFYIVVSTFLSGLLKTNQIDMPIWGIALMPNRRLPSYFLFFLIVVFLKFIEVEHIQRGGTRESYIEVLSSRKSALAFSVFTSIALAAICLVDFLLKGFTRFSYWGVGQTYMSALAIPFIMLFTFNKKPKHKWPDIFIPIYYVINYVTLFVFVFVLLLALPELIEMLM